MITRNGRELLLNVDLDILPREIVTLIGPNGAGKTTLVRVLLGLEKPDRGEVRRRKDLRVGYVPQRFDVDTVIPDDGGALPDAGRQVRRRSASRRSSPRSTPATRATSS